MAKRPPLTHFLCVPLITQSSRPHFEAAASTFKDKLRASSAELHPDVLGRAIRPIGTLHLTLGVMSLQDQERIDGAIKLLHELDWQGLPATGALSKGTNPQQDASNAENPSTTNKHPAPQDQQPEAAHPETAAGPFTLALTGLQSMKNASKTSVLYAEPIVNSSSDHLLPFLTSLRDRFTEAGFMLEENRPLKLHATILNTLYASGKGKARGRKKPVLIDATRLIEECRDLVWAENVTLERVAICEMGAEKVVEGEEVVDERYREVVARGLVV